MPQRYWLIAVGLVAVVVVSASVVLRRNLVHASDTDLEGRFDPYIHRPHGELADPINLIFRGTDANAVEEIARRVLDWRTVRGGAMSFMDNGRSRPTAAQLGLDLGHGSRWHMRIESVSSIDGQSYVLAAVHRDDTIPCGHVGRAFGPARETVAQAFVESGYRVTTLRLHNTEPGRQCDGSLTYGAGTANVIDLSSRNGGEPPARWRLPAGSTLPQLLMLR